MNEGTDEVTQQRHGSLLMQIAFYHYIRFILYDEFCCGKGSSNQLKVAMVTIYYWKIQSVLTQKTLFGEIQKKRRTNVQANVH